MGFTLAVLVRSVQLVRGLFIVFVLKLIGVLDTIVRYSVVAKIRLSIFKYSKRVHCGSNQVSKSRSSFRPSFQIYNILVCFRGQCHQLNKTVLFLGVGVS